MKKAFTRVLAIMLTVMMMVAMLPAAVFAAEADAAEKSAAQQPFRVLSVDEMVAAMGTGWNLGNTFDGHTGFTPSETLWQSVYTYQGVIDAVHDYGFNTVRIPVTWGNMIKDDYSIDEKWISRIQDVVDYCIKNGMYVIVNIHHDGAEQAGWIRLADPTDEMYEKFAGVWNTIAERFKHYDEHLLFASMNEVTGDDGTAAGIREDMAVINKLNQIFVDTVRATGSNNAQRWLVCPGRYTNIGTTTDESNGFKLPNDTAINRLFVEIHYYDWQFGLSETMTTTEWTTQKTTALANDINKLVTVFTSKGIPVIMGEYGSINKHNPADRAYHHEVVNALCKAAGVVPIYWDNGFYDRTQDPDYCFTLVDRATLDLVDPETTWGIMRGYYADDAINAADLVKDTAIVTAMGINVPTELVLTAGESTRVESNLIPATSNDALVWKTSDTSVVNVLNGGFVTANAPGSAVITVATQSGSASKEIKVTVAPAKGTASISGMPAELELELGGYTYLETAITSDFEGDYVVYASSNEDIVTVSSVGKVLALAQGSAYITATTATGAVYVTHVTVVPPAPVANDSIDLSLNVYYNDADTGYFMNETGSQIITVTGDGQYTLTFDCATDLSDAARAAGVVGLNNLTAVYIKDQAVVEGKESKSYIDNCMIMWDEVVVDGVPMTVTMTEPKSALKANGQFDTNDPLNSWDGSYVEEVTVENNVLNITCVENPQKITVTFTISGLVFGDKTVAEVKPITTTSIEAVGESTLTFTEAGQTAEITVKADNPKALIAFYTSDASVATVAITGTVNDDKSVTAVVTAVGAGECVITAITPDGKTCDIAVSSAAALAVEGEDEGTANEEKAPLDTNKILTIAAIALMALAVIAVIVIVIMMIKNGKDEKKSK